MRHLRLLLVLSGLGTLNSAGCMIMRDVARTTAIEPAEYPTHAEHVALWAHARKMAENAWKETYGTRRNHRDDYRKGFISGYADYIQYGGNGEPPALPPRCYWAKETPEGRQLAREWFEGFREGAALAIESGERDLILVPAYGPSVGAPSQPAAAPAAPPATLPAPKVLN